MTLSETHIHDPDPPRADHSTKLARMAGWTEAMEDDLRLLVAGNEHNFAEIGGLIGKNRGAVARRIKSLGIQLPPKFQVHHMKRGRGITDAPPRPVREVLAIVEFNPADFTESNVYGIDALEPHHCRFIVNDDPAAAIFCGLPMLEKSSFSFCAGHHRICVKPVPERRTA